jgi:hypothetical protein
MINYRNDAAEGTRNPLENVPCIVAHTNALELSTESDVCGIAKDFLVPVRAAPGERWIELIQDLGQKAAITTRPPSQPDQAPICAMRNRVRRQ